MAKIIIIMSVGSHQNATFGLAKELIKYGHKVIYAGAETGIYQENLALTIINQGFYYEILDPYEFHNDLEKDTDLDKHTNAFINFAENLLDGGLFADFVDRVQPDLILLDIRLPLYAIAFFPFKIPVLFSQH